MEKILVSLIYAAACAGVHAGKATYYGHHEMMEDLRQWIVFNRRPLNWVPFRHDGPEGGWVGYYVSE
jgi:hypothetical protein